MTNHDHKWLKTPGYTHLSAELVQRQKPWCNGLSGNWIWVLQCQRWAKAFFHRASN